ncbi:hypothetical protein ACVIIY_001876 [Bradyrhizobium sp. USDA 4515]
MIPSANWSAGLLGTRLAFFVAGFGLAAWAPLVPLAKERLGVDNRVLGLLLLCLGAGSVIAMLLTSVSNARYGSKPIIIAGGLGISLILPWLAVAGTPLSLGAMLFAFGVSLGSIDVAMNIHAIELEHVTGRPLMSGFHAQVQHWRIHRLCRGDLVPFAAAWPAYLDVGLFGLNDDRDYVSMAAAARHEFETAGTVVCLAQSQCVAGSRTRGCHLSRRRCNA